MGIVSETVGGLGDGRLCIEVLGEGKRDWRCDCLHGTSLPYSDLSGD